MYKIVKSLDVVEWEEEIEFRNIRRGHELSFNRESFKSKNRNDFAHYVSIRHSFFTNRLTQTWNKLLVLAYGQYFIKLANFQIKYIDNGIKKAVKCGLSQILFRKFFLCYNGTMVNYLTTLTTVKIFDQSWLVMTKSNTTNYQES